MKFLNITCRFCGKIIGKLEYEDWVKPPNTDDFLDSRCDTHRVEHGTIQEMEENYRNNINSSGEGFKEMLAKSDFKKSKMDEQIEKVLLEKANSIITNL